MSHLLTKTSGSRNTCNRIVASRIIELLLWESEKIDKRNLSILATLQSLDIKEPVLLLFWSANEIIFYISLVLPTLLSSVL